MRGGSDWSWYDMLHTQNHFSLLETWHLIQPNIPTRTAMFSNLSGLLIIVTTQEKLFPLCLESLKKRSSILPTKSLGGTGLAVAQKSVVGRPMLGKKGVHSAAAAWNCNGLIDPWPLLPRTEALSLESCAEVAALSQSASSTVHKENPCHCSDILSAHKSKTSNYPVDLLWIPVAACPVTQLLNVLVKVPTKRGIINHL